MERKKPRNKGTVRIKQYFNLRKFNPHDAVCMLSLFYLLVMLALMLAFCLKQPLKPMDDPVESVDGAVDADEAVAPAHCCCTSSTKSSRALN